MSELSSNKPTLKDILNDTRECVYKYRYGDEDVPGTDVTLWKYCGKIKDTYELIVKQYSGLKFRKVTVITKKNSASVLDTKETTTKEDIFNVRKTTIIFERKCNDGKYSNWFKIE